MVFNAGYEVPAGLLSKIDELLNDNLDRFLQIEPDENGNGWMVNAKLSKALGGIGNIESFIQMIKAQAEEQECPYLTRPYQEILELL